MVYAEMYAAHACACVWLFAIQIPGAVIGGSGRQAVGLQRDMYFILCTLHRQHFFNNFVPVTKKQDIF